MSAGPGHAVIALESELLALRDTYRHLMGGGEPGLSPGERAELLSQLNREMRETRAGLEVLRSVTGTAARVRAFAPPTRRRRDHDHGRSAS